MYITNYSFIIIIYFRRILITLRYNILNCRAFDFLVECTYYVFFAGVFYPIKLITIYYILLFKYINQLKKTCGRL